ncbi:t-SNARE [Glomus cerebriforme]|uniref:t-SNARE n=1 Tax=Glomus cerebriforme TaxID=658196 RepID=A0A397ST72_9GLOM|nr:t-SNARE [Glomus cerebriforme]
MSTYESLPPHEAVEIPMERIESESQAGPSTGGGGQSLGEFFKEVNAIQEMIRNIKENMSGIEALHKRTLVTVTDDESSRMSRQLDLLISETSRIAGQISNKLALMEQNNKVLPTGQDQTQMRLSHHATLAKSFIDTMTTYRRMQMENEKKYKERIVRQFRIVKPDVTQQDIDQLLNEESGPIFTSQILSKTQSEQSRAILTEVQDRQRDIIRIEKSIAELNKMFSEVQALVLEEDNKVKKMTEATNAIQDDDNQEEQVTRTTMKVKKKWKIIGLILLLIIIIVAVTLAVVLTQNNG